MAQISVTIAGRVYRMACADGEEEHLEGLASQIDQKIGEMRAAFGEIGDQRLTVMAAITVADELAESRRHVAKLEQQVAELTQAREAALSVGDDWAQTVAEALDGASERIEAIAQQMNAGGKKA